MRVTFGILLSAILVCGCSQKRTTYIDHSVEIVAGKEIVVGEYAVNVQQRDGNSLKGIRVVQRTPEGKETIITADAGTVTEGPKQRTEMTPTAGSPNANRIVVVQNTVKLTLFNANVQIKTESSTNRMTIQQAEVNL